MSDAVRNPRPLERQIVGRATADGDGVRLTRVLTADLQRRLDPFLMLDAFGSDQAADYIGGFPPHPHRGFETITYMLAGKMRHQDSAGHSGMIEDGGLQWMLAGRGVIHSEMPEQTQGLLEGFQLWLNLPAAHKMDAPDYRDVPASAIPAYTTEHGVTVRVLGGESHGVTGAFVRPHTQPLYLDVQLPAGAAWQQTLPVAHNAFVYVYRGTLQIGGNMLEAGRMGILANGADYDGVALQAGGEPARVIVVAGQPLGEPIVQYGPFVMNTRAEIEQTLDDYRSGRLA